MRVSLWEMALSIHFKLGSPIRLMIMGGFFILLFGSFMAALGKARSENREFSVVFLIPFLVGYISSDQDRTLC